MVLVIMVLWYTRTRRLLERWDVPVEVPEPPVDVRVVMPDHLDVALEVIVGHRRRSASVRSSLRRCSEDPRIGSTRSRCSKKFLCLETVRSIK